MDQIQREPTFDESVKQVMRTLPPPIRHYLGQGKYSEVANQLMTKYGLHIDQAGILEREIMLLLMGIENPDEFTKSLIEEARLDQQTVNRIVQDVNAQIFVPLREEMRKGGGSRVSSSEQKTTTPPSLKAMEGTARTTIISANPNLPQRPAQTLASVPRYVPPKKYFNLQNKIPPPVPTPPIQPVQPQRRDVIPAPAETKLLEDHEEPHIEFSKTPMPAKTAPPPPNLPGVIQPAPIPEPPRASPEATQGAAPPTKPIVPVAPVIPVAPYSSDPYREPIEP